MVVIFRKKRILISGLLLTLIIAVIISAFNFIPEFKALTASAPEISNEELIKLLDHVFKSRNDAMQQNKIDVIKPLYNTKLRNGLWAFEHQAKKVKYLHQWADKQGVIFTEIKTQFKIRWARKKGSGVAVNIVASTEYVYIYENEPNMPNILRIGTYHDMDLMPEGNLWHITREWYTDPFADSLNLDNIKTEANKQYIISQQERDYSALLTRRINAVQYADRYCGAAADEEYGWNYNSKYKNYNPLGGDCANFASQVLYEGGKFKKTGTWNYDRDGSQAWLNAQAFKNYLINSGRASLIASGSYDKVLKASYKLLPGDIVAYEKKGKITHVSVVTGADNKGYTLVNCHNTDRYRVPWDLGWSDIGIKFHFVRVHY